MYQLRGEGPCPCFDCGYNDGKLEKYKNLQTKNFSLNHL